MATTGMVARAAGVRRRVAPAAVVLGGGMAGVTNAATKRAKVTRLLDALRAGGAIGTSCAQAGINRRTYYRWREADPAFAADADDAIEYGTDVLEDVVFQRAVMTSDTLAIFLLKSRRPEKYRETTRHEISGPDGAPLMLRTSVVAGDDGR